MIVFFKYTSNSYKLYRPTEGKERDEIWKQLFEGLEVMEQELIKRGKPDFFGGKEVQFVDYMIWPWMERLPGLELLGRVTVPWETFPLVVSYVTLRLGYKFNICFENFRQAG